MGIARYFRTESALLSIAGALVGLALAWGAVRLLVGLGPASLPRLDEVRLDGITIGFTFVLTLMTAVAFAAIPLWHGAPLAMIVRQGAFVALAGIAAGLAIALSASRLIASLLVGVSARDPGVFVATALTLLVVALLACWLPARRASRLNPLEALRTE